LDENFLNLKRKLSAREEQALFDLNYYLPDEMLHRVDMASMKYSLEVRVPLLDHRIIEYALNIDPEIKFKNGTLKNVLKQVLYQYIPQQYFDRPKWGFTMPLAHWLKTDLKYLIDNFLNKLIVEEASFVQYAYVEQLLKQFYSGKDYLQQRVWLLVLLHKWHAERLIQF
jgi:asparagine synthase (glutamine-hydrolysing)